LLTAAAAAQRLAPLDTLETGSGMP
jgi:hypothetical protein